jgi:hypothetical protein
MSQTSLRPVRLHDPSWPNGCAVLGLHNIIALSANLQPGEGEAIAKALTV